MQLGMDEFTALHVIAGISAYQIGNLEQAYFYLNKAEPNLVAESVARRVLAQTQLKLGYIDEVADEVGKWSVDNQEDSIILGSVIGSMLQEGDLAGATSLSIGINQNGDSSAIEQLREGMLRIASKDNSGLVNIENALQKDPSLEKAWVLLAQAQVKDGNISEALNVAKEWQKQEPDDGQVLEALIYSQNQEYDRAFGLLDEVLDRSPSNLGANQLSMNLLSTKQSYKKLLIRARAFLDFYPENKGTLFMLANLGKVSEINQELESILLSQLNSTKKIRKNWEHRATLFGEIRC
jgi:tetratricopeptide (TPR) repeat protein